MRCRHCSEPWDLDTLHDVVAEVDDPETTFDTVYADFRVRGCAAIEQPWGKAPCGRGGASELIGVLTDVFGHDPDGLESDLEDAELFGLL